MKDMLAGLKFNDEFTSFFDLSPHAKLLLV